MVNYANGKIYKIVCNVTGKIYIGSTTKKYLCDRLANHVCKYKMWKDDKREYVSSFAVIDSGSYNIVLIEKYPCTSKDELHRRERHYIESLECVNLAIPGRTSKEYYEENKEVISAKSRLYREKNKAVIAQKKNVKHSCVCGGKHTQSNRAQHIRSEQHQYYLKRLEQYNQILKIEGLRLARKTERNKEMEQVDNMTL